MLIRWWKDTRISVPMHRAVCGKQGAGDLKDVPGIRGNKNMMRPDETVFSLILWPDIHLDLRGTRLRRLNPLKDCSSRSLYDYC
jgi:hypothetical protein